MPDEVLEEGDVGEDVALELLALEEDLLEHGHGNRVDDGVLVHLDVVVVAVLVVDRSARQGGQGVVDDTFVRVGKFHVLIRGGIGGAQADLPPVLEVGIEVGTHRETLEFGTDDGTFLIHPGTGDIVLDLVAAALGADLVLMLEGCTEDGILPVGTLAEDGRIAVFLVLADHADRLEVVVVLGEFAQVQQVDATGLALQGDHAVVGEFRIAAPTALGGDEDDTVRTLGTVDSRRGSILEDFHADDIGRVDRGQRGDRGDGTVAERVAQTEVGAALAAALHDDAVNDVQRFGVGVDGRLATDADGGRGARSTGGLDCLDTGRTALEGLVDVGNDGTLDGVFLHGDGGAGKVALFHGTVTDDDDLVEQFGIFKQQDVDDGLVADHDFLLLVAD